MSASETQWELQQAQAVIRAGRCFIQCKKFLPNHTLAVLKNNRKWVWVWIFFKGSSPYILTHILWFIPLQQPPKIRTILWISGCDVLVWFCLVPLVSVQMPLCWVARPLQMVQEQGRNYSPSKKLALCLDRRSAECNQKCRKAGAIWSDLAQWDIRGYFYTKADEYWCRETSVIFRN